MAVWPAGQVLAQAASAYGLKAREKGKPLTALELGANPEPWSFREMEDFLKAQYLIYTVYIYILCIYIYCIYIYCICCI